MSKPHESLYQVHEITRVAVFSIMQPFEITKKICRQLLVLSCCAWFVGCGQQGETTVTSVTPNGLAVGPSGQTTLNRGLLGEPRTLDPQLADDTYSFQVIRDLYEGLTAEDRSGKIVPGAAKSWAIDPTGTVYKFELRSDAEWSDGTRIAASEFVQGLRRAVDPQTASGSAEILTIIKGATEIIAGRKKVSELGVSALDDSTIQIELEHPAPYILEILSQPISAPIHANMLPKKSERTEGQENTATNGAYTLAAHVPGSYIELLRNSHYWDAANVAIEKVRYINSESEGTELREYLSGQLDLTFTIPASDIQRISKQYPSQVQSGPFLATLYLALNLDSPSFKNAQGIRQALSMSLDREIIAGHIIAGVTPAYAFVAKGVREYVPENYSWSQLSRGQQLIEAKNLYQKAGYSEKNPLRLRLYFNQDEGIRRLMIAIAGSWKQNLGVESELISDEFRVFLAGRKDKSRWDVARLGWTADYDDPSSFLDVFAPTSSQNDPGYRSAAFGSLIDRAQVEPRDQQRMELLKSAEQVLLNDYPIIPIYFYTARRLVKPYLGGAQLTPMNRTYTKHLFWQSAP